MKISDKSHLAAAETQNSRTGMALVLLLLVISAAVVLTLQAQVTASLAMRRAQRRLAHANLRIAATDAAWNSILEAAAANKQTSGTNSTGEEVAVLPSGVETRVKMTPAGNSQNSGSKGPVSLVMIEATASVSGITETVSCMLEKPKSGKTRVVGWNQDT